MDQPTGIEALVAADIAERQRRGIDKYGTTLADNPLTHRDALQHAYEEALDLAIYLKKAMDTEPNDDEGLLRRELAECKSVVSAVVNECDAVFVDTDDMSPEWRAIERAARATLRKFANGNQKTDQLDGQAGKAE